jgi:hypothetical protein
MTAPPELAGAAQVNVTLPSSGVAEIALGAPGVVTGVATTWVAAPSPTAVSGITRRNTGVPFANPLTRAEVVFAEVVVRTVHVDPLSDDSTR